MSSRSCGGLARDEDWGGKRSGSVAKDVGLIGVGLLGSALAERLLAAGFTVHAFDPDQARLKWLSEHGGRPAANASELADRCSCLLLSLPDSKVVQQVLSELSFSRAGSLILDTTTGSPDDAQRFASQLAERGSHYVEVNIAGSSTQVRSGDAVALVGAPADLRPEVQLISACFAKRAIWVGAPGQASRMKLAVNLVLGLNRAALAEGLAFAAALGLDEGSTLEVLQAGPAYSRAMDAKGAKMLSGDYTPQARLRQHLKDVELILEQAQHQRLMLPLSEAHRHLLKQAVTLGLAELDNSAIRLVYVTSNKKSEPQP